MRKIFTISFVLLAMFSYGQGPGTFSSLTAQSLRLNGYKITAISTDGTSMDGGLLSVPTSKAVKDYVSSRVSGGWKLTGDTVMPSIHFLGSINDSDVVFKRNLSEAGRLSTSSTSFGTLAKYQASGDFNSYFGSQAGMQVTGNNNTMVGYQTGLAGTGSNNVNIGYQAGSGMTGSGNVYLGSETGGATNGSDNVILGSGAGLNHNKSFSTIIGAGAGANNTGRHLSSLGAFTGVSNSGDTAVLVGFSAGESNSGNRVTIIGRRAGKSNAFHDVIILGDSGVATATKQLAIGPKYSELYFPGMSSGAGYVLTDVSGNNRLTLQPNTKTLDQVVHAGNLTDTTIVIERNVTVSNLLLLAINNKADDGDGAGGYRFWGSSSPNTYFGGFNYGGDTNLLANAEQAILRMGGANTKGQYWFNQADDNNEWWRLYSYDGHVNIGRSDATYTYEFHNQGQRISGIRSGFLGGPSLWTIAADSVEDGNNKFQLPDSITGTPVMVVAGVTPNKNGVLDMSTIIATGTYTPTVANEGNVDAISFEDNTVNYQRVLDNVTVWGQFDIDPTSPNTSTVFDMSVPIASAFGDAHTAAGTAVSLGDCPDTYAALYTGGGRITVKTENNSCTDAMTFSFIFTYKIL